MTETAEPPSYDDHGFEALAISSNERQSDLPAYSRRPTPPPAAAPVEREPRVFSYQITNRGGKPLAAMAINGDPRLTKVIPTILAGSNVTGSVSLTLQSGDPIQEVCLVLKGEIVNGDVPIQRTAFVELKKTLWSTAEGDPLQPSMSGKNWNGKLKGDYNWPFSIELQTTVSKNGQTYNLPHTFLERLARFSVQYTLELRLLRSKLRTDDKLTATFGYFSMRQPDPPSPLRKLAYQENSPLLGPESDPEGWHTLEPFSIDGVVFSARYVSVKCTFSLAKPLCYTRASSIPCSLTIETSDPQALDLLSSPKAPFVYLERLIRSNTDDPSRAVDVFGSTYGREPCGQAVFWPSNEGVPTDTSSQRRLDGEVHLRNNLQPSSAVAGFAVEYALLVFPFQVAGFKAADNSPLVRQDVEIVTRYSSGLDRKRIRRRLTRPIIR
ncbi:hypothetical protein B0H10DRAFT_1868027 [Mycena sp. CBHHK59/15]|nr:hypothetical protein B0H10DRAFT_1868027 [Mycena sp. CBHHK59/15]